MLKKHKMNFFMNEQEIREELRRDYPCGVYTLDLIRDGKRRATTRPHPLGKVEEKVILYNSHNPSCEALIVEITHIEKLDITTPEQAELWSRKEGWSTTHLSNNPHLLDEWQTTFEVVITEQGDQNGDR